MLDNNSSPEEIRNQKETCSGIKIDMKLIANETEKKNEIRAYRRPEVPAHGLDAKYDEPNLKGRYAHGEINKQEFDEQKTLI